MKKTKISRILFFAVIGIGLTSCSTAPSPPSTMLAPFDKLVFDDEFNGKAVNTAVWKYETFATGWRNSWNSELQDYVDDGEGGENAFIKSESDGTSALILRATHKTPSYGIHDFQSARMTTQSSYSFTYGRIEARMKLPKGNGMWPAFWMLGSSSAPWPTNGEIDILEMIGGSKGTAKQGGDNTAFTTLHWGTNPNHPSFQRKTTLQDLSQYHVYTMNWTPQNLTASLDGVEYFRFDISGADKAAFHKPFYLLLNLSVGGQWGGNPDSSTSFPQEFGIDYIRVYQ